MAVNKQVRRTALEEVGDLARELQAATSARERYAISTRINEASKRAVGMRAETDTDRSDSPRRG